MLQAVCRCFLQKMYRQRLDVSTGFCRLHYVMWQRGIMHHQNILITVLKVAAIFIFIDIVNYLPNQLADYNLAADPVMKSAVFNLMLLPVIAKVIVISVLWFFPSWLISSIVPDKEFSDQHKEYFKNLDVGIITGIGVYLVAYSIGDIAYSWVLKTELQAQYMQPMSPQDKGLFVASIVQCLTGFVLVLGSRGFAYIIRVVRQ